ncbi:molybdate ABC transporter substrate-binding protein [Thalassotalea ganghwensis]
MSKFFKLSILLCLLTITNLAKSQSLTVAVASNFYASAVNLAKHFEQEHKVEIKLASGATGVLYAQITKGAPYDLFLSADKMRPMQLFQQGLAYQNQQYTLGKLALWMPKTKTKINRSTFEKYQGRLAIANPKLAPYGVAAQQVLANLKFENIDKIQNIIGNNVNQVFHYIDSGNVNAGFVPLSLLILAKQKQPEAFGKAYTHFWVVPESYYQPIEQHATILKRTRKFELAQQFLKYIRSPESQAILEQHGYKAI